MIRENKGTIAKPQNEKQKEKKAASKLEQNQQNP